MEKASELLEEIGKLMAPKPDQSLLKTMEAYQEAVKLIKTRLDEQYTRGYNEAEIDFKKKMDHQILNN